LRTVEEIQKQIDVMEADERLSYPTATIVENAPLALIQLSLQTKINALRWTLEKIDTLIVGQVL